MAHSETEVSTTKESFIPTTRPIPTMLTIKETAARTGLSYDFLRKGCLEGRIVHIRAGCKFLINFDKLIDYMNGGDNA